MWSEWTSVADGSSVPGAPVCIVPEFYSLIAADSAGGVYTATGDPTLGWGRGWTTLAQGGTAPGGAVNGLGYGALSGPNKLHTKMAAFLADPNAGVYAAGGNPETGWGRGWATVHWGNSRPGAPITAVQYGTQIAVFIADIDGGIWTSVGEPETSFNSWVSVSQGETLPGSLVNAVPIASNRFLLFLTDPNGGIYTLSGSPAAGWGPWRHVKEITAPPGAPVTVVGSSTFLAFVTDVNGDLKMAAGDTNLNWWPTPATVSQPPLTLLPGTPVTALYTYVPNAYVLNLFVTDSTGHIWTTWSADETGAPIQSRQWSSWSMVSPDSGVGKPGAPVSAGVLALNLCLVISDANGNILISTQPADQTA